MQARKKLRRNINVPGRYFTGIGAPVDIALRDISEGGCRFPLGSAQLARGAQLQIIIAGTGPLRGSVRWIEDGDVGVTFKVPLDSEVVEQLKSSHIHGTVAAAPSGEFAPMTATPDGLPRRFC